MQEAPFYLDQQNKQTIIRSRHNESFALNIYDLDEPFAAPPGQLVLFGQADGRQLAFETTGKRAKIKEVTAALTWYSESLDQDLQITTIDPRPHGHLRVIR